MSDIFSFNGNYENPTQKNEHTQSENDFWRQKNERRAQLNKEYQEDLDRYSVNISQEDYNIIKDAIANADVPEDEAYRWACAMELNKQYGMPVSYAYQNLEQINAAKWGDRFTFTPKTNFKAIVDSGRLGANTLKMGRLGSKIMKAQMFGKTEYNNYLAGKVETLDDMMAEYAALEQESAELTDLEDRNFAIEALKFAAQSAPYTGYVAGVGLLGGLLSGGAGTAAAFAVSMDNAAGLEYMRLRKAGSDVGDAAGFAILSGGLQALVETSLGNVAGALGKKSLGDLATQAAKNKITGNVFKRLAYDGTFKTLALRMGKEWAKENAEEGLEEVVQDLIEKGTDALAAELGGYEIEGLDAKTIARDAWENFRGGVMGSLILGLPASAIKGKADIKEFVNVRKLAEVTPSQETFNKLTDNSTLWEGMNAEEKKSAQKTTWENAQARVEAAAETEAKKIAEGRDAAEGAEEAQAENEDGQTEVNPVARDDTGRLITKDEVYTDENGNTTGGTFRVGDTSKSEEEGNRYGYIKYSTAENGDITIDSFKMTEGREQLRKEVFEEFAREHPDVNIEWNAIGSDMQDAKQKLIDENPNGSKNGLNYYTSESLNDIQTKKDLGRAIREKFHNVKAVRYFDENNQAKIRYEKTQLTSGQVASVVALFDTMAQKNKQSLSAFLDQKFVKGVFGTTNEMQADVRAYNQKHIGEQVDENRVTGGFIWKNVEQGTRAIIYAAENADYLTLMHELAHFYQSTLTGDLKAEAEAAFDVQDGDWSAQSKWKGDDGKYMSKYEAFAYHFQDWLTTGRVKNETWKNVFEKFAQFLAQAYTRLKNHLAITPEIESVFEKMLGDDKSIMAKALKAAQEEEGEYRAMLKRDAEAKEAQKKAEAEEAKRQSEAEREEASEGTDFSNEEAEQSTEEIEKKLDEVTNEKEPEGNAIDDALEDLNLTDDKKAEIAETLKDESSTVVEKAEAATEAASSVYDEEDGELPDMMFQEVTEEDFKNRIESIQHTQTRQEYIDRYYTNHPELYENKKFTSRDGKRTDEIEISKDKDLFEEKTRIEIDAALKFKSIGIEPTILSESQKIGSEKHIDMLLNHKALVEIKTLKGNAQTVSNEIKDAMNKKNSELITVMMFDNNDVTDEEIQKCLDWHGEHEHVHSDTDGIFIFRDDNITEIKKPRVVPKKARTSGNSNIAQEIDAVKQKYQNTDKWLKAPNGEDSNLNEKQWLQVRTPSFKKWYGDWENDPANASKVLDENGEPLVVYHGSSQWFQVFNEGKTNKSSNVNTPDNTIFTNDNKEIASSFQNYYGGKVTDVILDENSPLHRKYDWGTYRAGGVYSLFMNLRNPKIVDYKGQTWKADGMNINDEVAKAMQEGYDGFIAKNIIDVGFTDVTPPASNDYIAFNNTDVKSATDNNGNFDANNPNILFQIAGEIGAENLDNSEVQEGVSRMQNLAIAKQMETDGKDAKTIRLATGWEKGSDGKWRYELDDSKIKVENDFYPDKYFLNKYPRLRELEEKIRKDITAYNNFTDEERNDYDYYSSLLSKFVRNHIDFVDGKQIWKEPVELNDVMEAPELFKAYPQLEKIKFIVKKLEAGLQGQYDADTDTITLSPMAGKSTLLHEVQHAIQDIEGFAKGGNERQFDEISAEPLREKVSELNKKMSEVLTEYVPLEDWLAIDQKLLEQNLSPEEYAQARIDAISKYDNGEYRKLAEEQQEIISRIEEIEDNALEGQVEVNGRTYEDAFEAYRSLAGEVEARNVQTRMNFTPEERHEALLAATEDVDRDDQIMLFQTVYHGSGADFDKFDTENYGLSGEGSMSFGYGTYVTDSEEIARDYAERQRKQIDKYADNPYERDTLEREMFEELRSYDFDKSKYKDYLENQIKESESDTIDNPYIDRKAREKLDKLDAINSTNLYTVEIPDNSYISWNEPVTQEMLDRITPVYAEEMYNRWLNDSESQDGFIVYNDMQKKGIRKSFEDELQHELDADPTYDGAQLYKHIQRKLEYYDKENGAKLASKLLNKAGYAGIKYPAGTIHGNGNGAYNYVIFNDDDAQIVDKLLFQTQAELMDEARTFDTWQEFMEYCELFHSDDEVSPIPSDSDAQWYQSFWEQAKGVQTEQEKNKQEIETRAEKNTTTAKAVDALFSTYLKTYPQMIDEFLKAVADIDAINLDSEEWQQAESAEDAEQRDKIDQLKDFINITLSDYNWQTALKRIQGGHEIAEGLRKRLIGEITDGFKVRDFRALYAEVMNDEQYAVAPEDSITAVLNKKLRKYHDIVKPGDDISKWSPERRKQLAEQLQNREIAAKIKNGSLKLDDELDAYIKSLTKQIKEKQKQFDELEAETKADYQRIADKERRDLLKLHEQLLLARGKLNTKNAEVNRKIAKGLKITEKYSRAVQNLNANYDEIFRKYEDLRNSITINSGVQAALDRQEQVAGLREDLNAKQKEKNLTAEVKKMRIQLVKKTMRRVPFNRIDYNNARTVIAIQRMLEPNLLGGVNRFIGIDSPYLRGVISQIVTDSDYKEKILNYLSKNSKASQAFADFKKKLSELKSIKDFDSWTAKERKAAIKYLPKENWVRDLNLKELAKEREESIDLDIDMEEVKRTVYDEKTGEPKTYKDKEGITHNVTETAFKLKADEAIERLVQDAVGADMFDKIVNMPFSEWTTEDLETLAQRIDELYTEGRDLKAAKDEARKKEAAAIRKRIEDAIKDTGITINDDDTPEEKERKQKQIEKILGMSNDLKGTEAGKDKGFKAKITRLLHSYFDMNVLRFARMLDGQSEGENVRMLYRKEDDCYNAKQRSMNSRAEKIYKVMKDNNITEGDLAKTVKVTSLGTEFTVDELLYFLAADKDYVEDEKKVQRGLFGLDANDDYAATSRNAVMFGNMMSDMMSQEEKESWLQLDKDMQEALQNDTLTQEQKEQQAAGFLDKTPGTTRYIAACHAKWGAVLGAANSYLNEHPQYKALMEAIEADYASQYERMNEVSINEFNMPVHRVKAYVPLVRRESNGDTNEAQVKEDLLGAAGVGKQWADRGMTQRRVQISPLNQKPVQTGLFTTWGSSIERTEHFIAYAPYVRQLNAIYKSRDASYTRRFIESRYGAGAIKYLDEYINEVANPNAGRIRERGAELLHVLRGKTAPAYLGWKASGIIKQGLTSPWPYMQFVNPAEYMAAAMKFSFNPEMREAIKEKSVFMKMRRMDPVNDLIDEMADNAKTKIDRGWSNFTKLGMQGLELIDWACVAPGWLACYEKKYNQLQNASNARYESKMAELKERNMYAEVGTSEYLTPQQMEAEAKKEILEDIETEAVRYADDCTRACQPSNRVTDLAPLFKNSSEAMKAFLQFQTSLNVIWQNLRYDMPYAVKNKEFTRIAGTVIGYVCAGIFMNSVMEGIGGDDDDDDTQALRNLIYYSTTQFTDAVPILGSEITNVMDKVITGKRAYAQSGTDMTPSATKLLTALQNTTSGNWKKAAELTAEGIGLYLGAPVSGTKEIYKLLGKPLSEGDVNFKRGISDVYGLAGDILEE